MIWNGFILGNKQDKTLKGDIVKIYHMQIRYILEGTEVTYLPNEDCALTRCVTKTILDWTDIENAPSFEDMKKSVAKDKNKIFIQEIRMVANDGEYFHIGHNIQNNYPHQINHLHK